MIGDSFSVFDLWPDRIETATFWRTEQTMSGKSKSEPQTIQAIFDEHRMTNPMGQTIQVTSATTAYVLPTSPVAKRDCIGGFIKTQGFDPRTFRIDDLVLGKGNAEVSHVELILSEVAR